jgi:hypothetical protein
MGRFRGWGGSGDGEPGAFRAGGLAPEETERTEPRPTSGRKRTSGFHKPGHHGFTG